MRGRKIAYLSVALGLAVLLATGIAAKEHVLRSWYLYQLEHGESQSREDAAKRLADMRSTDAVPAILRAALRAHDGRGVGGRHSFMTVNLPKEGKPFQDAIVKMDSVAVPALLVCLAVEDELEAWLSAQILEIIYAKHNQNYRPYQSMGISSWEGSSTKWEAPPGVSVRAWKILTALQSDGTLEPAVRQAAADALKKIQGARR